MSQMVPTLELPFVIIPFFFFLFLLIPLLFHFSKLEILESSLNPACFYYSTQPTIKSYYFFLQHASSFTSSGLPSIPGHIPITATWIDLGEKQLPLIPLFWRWCGTCSNLPLPPQSGGSCLAPAFFLGTLYGSGAYPGPKGSQITR